MNKVRRFAREAEYRLAELSTLLRPGAKLTLVVRFEDEPEQDIIVSSDSLEGVAAAVERRRNAEATAE